MARTLYILSGGAAQGLVARLQPDFEARHGCRIEGTFGAVGLMKEKLLAGAPCDLLILTAALVRELGEEGRALGVVKTGLAVKAGAQAAPIASPDDLRAFLQAAGAVYFPDPAKATAGIHFMKVLTALGLAQPLAQRLRTFPNGAAAMAALAQAPEDGAVGCTQVTEILFTPGVRLAGLLPEPHGLATTYTAAVRRQAKEPELASALLAALAAPEAEGIRRACGFEP
ncbi:MAG: molybdate ABC transporter substrate-binding protein [Ramlibacter sp.]